VYKFRQVIQRRETHFISQMQNQNKKHSTIQIILMQP